MDQMLEHGLIWILLALETVFGEGINFKHPLHWWVWWRNGQITPNRGGSHPLMVPNFPKDHLCSIIPWPIQRQEYDTPQVILGILGHQNRGPPPPEACVPPSSSR